MLLVDIQILAIDRTFDFELDENTRVDVLLEDILALTAQKEHILCKNPEAVYVYGMEQEAVDFNMKSLERKRYD